MDFRNSDGPTSPSHDVVLEEKNHLLSSSAEETHETNCWGCGLRVLVSPYASIFKCGWCGAITKQNVVKSDKKYFRLRRLRDRCFVTFVLVFILLFMCGGFWAIFPTVFSVSYFCGSVHLVIAVTLAISTLSTFSLSAFRPAGRPPMILWGSYPTVGKGGLENHTFCHYCSRPKSPRAHHCRSCGTCIQDMDHHCPFIGNCVGAANHRCFVLFLIATVISTLYTAITTSYVLLHIWPPVVHKPLSLPNELVDAEFIFIVVTENFLAFLRSAVVLPTRGIIAVYVFISSISVGAGLSVLLWQQLCYVYAGKTYLSHLTAVDSDEMGQRDCQNIVRFFGFPFSAAVYLPSYWKSRKRHDK